MADMKKRARAPRNLAELKADPRIKSVWYEGADGYWAELAPGFNRDGSGMLHEWSVKDLLRSAKCIEEGDPS